MRKIALFMTIYSFQLCIFSQNIKINCLEGDCKNGYGVVEDIKTGTILEAEFYNGQFTKGVLRFKNGNVYDGHFDKLQKFDSLGYFYHHDKQEYNVGYFSKGSLQNGFCFIPNKGVQQINDSKEVTTKSQFLNLSPALSQGRIAGHCVTGDCKNGVGIWLFPDGTQLKCEVEQGAYSNARLEWKNGTYYSGELNNLIQCGLGFFYSDSLNWKIGEFKNGLLYTGFEFENGTLSEYKRSLSPDDLKKVEHIKKRLDIKKSRPFYGFPD